MLLKGERTFVVRDAGGFVAHVNMPGWVKPKPSDHGHGPLAMVVESILAPGRQIAMHEHRNDEIVSWVPEGVMRHDDRATGRLLIDRDHLMVMNAGTGFWHSEETLATDPPLRMLQILIRPRAIDLEPIIQYGPIPAVAANVWRHLVGPEGEGAPFYVRSALDMFDIRLERARGWNSRGSKKGISIFVSSAARLSSPGKALSKASRDCSCRMTGSTSRPRIKAR